MNSDQLAQSIEAALDPAYRGRLLARGQARSIIWKDGELEEGSPNYSPRLSYDLKSYGTSLLALGLRLRPDTELRSVTLNAFEQSGEAIEAVFSKGDPNDPSRGFYKVLAASAFHLAGFSARAFSLLNSSLTDENFSGIERALALLILRSLDELENEIISFLSSGIANDEALQETLFQEEFVEDESGQIWPVLQVVLKENFYRSIAIYLSALASGDENLVARAKAELAKGEETCADLGMVNEWWVFKVASHLIDDLWNSSFHSALPLDVPENADNKWIEMRELYIASLYSRKRAEIELWPSQILAATRSVDTSDDLIVSLPTSAGKTRIAELCILRCLADGKRVVFVTPLRALSAQTERGLQGTFGTLGVSISALYGSIGTSSFEEDTLKERQIVVATPEKLDFALRNDPSILDDVGLVVLDEGHMIGRGEREVRYEVQIQRLLKRTDADTRRIVCLSAILPVGDQMDDFVNWLRRDQAGEAVSVDWRPTRVRFGDVVWNGTQARLNLKVGDEETFVPNFIGSRDPQPGRRTNSFPHNKAELVLATAWRLVEDGQSVLIYCPTKRSVGTAAESIVKLAGYGFLDSVLEVDEGNLASALSIGTEWLGADHAILKCLKMGIVIHHGSLPTPYRKEVEALLRQGGMKITVSSPTLAQGLNLTATTVVMQSLHRIGEVIPASEFKNVIGRAGRAFVDVEGLVLCPIFDSHDYRKGQWQELIASASQIDLESGLLKITLELLARLYQALDSPEVEVFVEYVLNNAQAWNFPEADIEDEEEKRSKELEWDRDLAMLDTAILSLIGNNELDAGQISATLDEVLSSSLWERSIARREIEIGQALKAGVVGRANRIWENSSSSQRKGYFLAGVGFKTGRNLDIISEPANELVIAANGAIISGDDDRAIEVVTELAELIFAIEPFVPKTLPDGWKDILSAWLRGHTLAGVGGDDRNQVLTFVEEALVYKLPWGIEALRVRAEANSDIIGDPLEGMTMGDFEVGLLAPALETGTLCRSAALLMQAGFSSRTGALKVITDSNASFENAHELKDWLGSEEVRLLTETTDWPTAETRQQWLGFRQSYLPADNRVWKKQILYCKVRWADNVHIPAASQTLRLQNVGEGRLAVLSPSMEVAGELLGSFPELPIGLLLAKTIGVVDVVEVKYFGPLELSFS
ncbi:DEAD/DEAH box helicase [Yoonia sp. I 8.24]|uniref:DEAD/DEAH box helicase n=1 Tax=Yoonia sp. I 8.24 TaxID=1537229 RepID=UPI001EDD38C1|nr:DEAD/DEAH box helicase [Yoonia sp. I 8.24]MCG3267152.1 DEAD/DEAH box helicase [Yoonia sp. I 8.24]